MMTGMTMSQPTEATREDILGAGPTLVLSPHMDDALLSAFGLVTSGPATVWTVFTDAPVPPQTTSWDVSCGFANSDETIAARRLEDAHAFEGTPASTRHLDALEGAYADPERRARDTAFIRGQLLTWLDANPQGTLVIPAGAGLHVPAPWWDRARDSLKSARSAASSPASWQASSEDETPSPQPVEEVLPEPQQSAPTSLLSGIRRSAISAVKNAMHADAQRRRRRVIGDDGLAANPDHIALRNIALDAAARHPGVRVVFYEDLPYLWHARGDAEIERVTTSRKLRAHKYVLPVDADAKFERLQRYPSQMPVMDTPGRLSTPGHIPSTEVYWALVK